MIPASFAYRAPESLEGAVDLLAEHGDEAKVLAGGQSLLPLLKLHFSDPALLVDLRELRRIERHDGALRVGALATHRQLGLSADGFDAIPDAVADLGDPMVRNRGTFGGSLAHADPAAGWPPVALALDARVRARSARGTREIPIDAFFVDVFTTALEPDEVITHVDLPRLEPGARSAYVKVPHPATGFAVAAAAVAVALGADGRCRRARVAITGAAATPYRARHSEARLVGREPVPAVVEAAAKAATDDVDVLGDGYAPAAYRRQLASVVTGKAIDLALSRLEETGWTRNR